MGESWMFFLVIAVIVYLKIKKTKTINQLRDEFHRSLVTCSRTEALNKGRLYYAKTRSGFLGLGYGKLTVYDENALTNDLSTMK